MAANDMPDVLVSGTILFVMRIWGLDSYKEQFSKVTSHEEDYHAIAWEKGGPIISRNTDAIFACSHGLNTSVFWDSHHQSNKHPKEVLGHVTTH